MEPGAAPRRRIGLWSGLRALYSLVSPKLRRELIAVLALMLLGAAAELAMIGSIIPFLALLSQSGAGANLPWAATLFSSLAENLGLSSIVATAIVFGTFAILAGVVRLELAWLTQDFVFRVAHELALETQRRILHQPYAFHIERNSSTLVSATDKIEMVVFDLILPVMQSLIAGFIAAFLVAGLLYIDPVATLIATAAFCAIYVLVSVVTRKRLTANSIVVGTAFNERLKIIQESLGGIRDVIIDNSQAMHTRQFDRVNSGLAHARATTTFMAQAPRYVVEALGMVVVAAIAVLLSGRPGGLVLAIPFLGALALGAQRLLPLVQTAYTGWSFVAAQRSIFEQALELLRLPLPEPSPAVRPEPLPLRKRIRFDQVSFSYSGRPDAAAIADVSIEIPAGSMVALVGETGAGKSTLADLLMGLVGPGTGRILVDNVPLTPANARRWQQSIAHVPQSIFLADTTIAANVALSRPDAPPDASRVMRALEMAQLGEFVSSLPQSADTVIGERGVRLSGGQRQRLGLARAIYKDAPVLVLDEATSSVDEQTEAAVIDALDQLRQEGRTIIIIAHRASTISRCDKIVRLHEGRLVEEGGFVGPSAVGAPH